MKLNLGSGYQRIDGFTNIDNDPLVEPDMLIELDDVNIKLPFDDDTVEEVRAYHILEHIGDGFIPLMKELYRVSQHGCIIDIEVPHHQHDHFYGDPTHKRPITVGTMDTFSKKGNGPNSNKPTHSGIAWKYNIDFEIVWFDYEYDPFYAGLMTDISQRKANGTLSPTDEFIFMRLMREATNVALHTKIKMIAIKQYVLTTIGNANIL